MTARDLLVSCKSAILALVRGKPVRDLDEIVAAIDAFLAEPDAAPQVDAQGTGAKADASLSNRSAVAAPASQQPAGSAAPQEEMPEETGPTPRMNALMLQLAKENRCSIDFYEARAGVPVWTLRRVADLGRKLERELITASAHAERLQREREEAIKALRWIQEIAVKNYEQDHKLRHGGARTLKRIADKAEELFAKVKP